MITLKNIHLRMGQKTLLDGANLSILSGEKAGIVGQNGVGKTTLFKMLLGELHADSGECDLPKQLKLQHLEQELPDSEDSVLHYVVSGDANLARIYKELVIAEEADDGMRLAELYNQLSECDGYSAEARAAKILKGLRFTDQQMQEPVNSLSGGWRMRLNLARLLASEADILLLDEPTNHLDLEAIYWLQGWLQRMPCSMILISHDREFLDAICSHIVHCKHQQLKKYTGNYSSFAEQYAIELSNQQAAFARQEKVRAHLQGFVDRFRYKASKAKQAQSRIKKLEKMENLAAVVAESPFRFEFKKAPLASDPMLQLNKASLGYPEHTVLEGVKWQLRSGDRIGILGENGAGKSTLVKALVGDLELLKGTLFKSTRLHVGYFAQQQLGLLRGEESALWHLQHVDPKILESKARSFLGGFNFSNDQVFQPVGSFSGGEKSRLVLALIIWQQPNLLLLDEPTNHLDMQMREALNIALQQFDGAMVLVSHDRHLMQSLVDEYWLIEGGSLMPFEDGLDGYLQLTS